MRPRVHPPLADFALAEPVSPSTTDPSAYGQFSGTTQHLPTHLPSPSDTHQAFLAEDARRRGIHAESPAAVFHHPGAASSPRTGAAGGTGMLGAWATLLACERPWCDVASATEILDCVARGPAGTPGSLREWRGHATRIVDEVLSLAAGNAGALRTALDSLVAIALHAAAAPQAAQPDRRPRATEVSPSRDPAVTAKGLPSARTLHAAGSVVLWRGVAQHKTGMMMGSPAFGGQSFHATSMSRRPAGGGPLTAADSPALPPWSPVGQLIASPSGSVASLPPGIATQHTMVASVGDEQDDGTSEVNQYVLLQHLGAGSQGEVFLAMDTERDELRAIKVVRRPKGSRGYDAGSPLAAARHHQWLQLEREVAIMKKCRHPHVVALYEVIDDPAQDCMYLVMQYIEHGPLITMTPDGTVTAPIPPGRLVAYARQLCAGLRYLHKHGVIHRDIKPDNILLGQNDQVYLADFGVAEALTADAEHRVAGTKGTLAFNPPELIGASEHKRSSHVDGEAVDVWALGVTLYVLLFGRMPWTKMTNATELFDSIENAPIDFPASPDTDITNSGDFGADDEDRRKSSAGSVDGSPFIPTAPARHAADPSPRSVTLPPVSIVASSAASMCETDAMSMSYERALMPRWHKLLRGMLARDPARRYTLVKVRQQLLEMEQNVNASAAASPPISVRKTRSGISEQTTDETRS